MAKKISGAPPGKTIISTVKKIPAPSAKGRKSEVMVEATPATSEYRPTSSGPERKTRDDLYKLRRRVGALEAVTSPPPLSLDETTEAAQTFPPQNQEVCSDPKLGNHKTVSTGLSNIYAVVVQQEFVYVKGDDGGGNGKLKIYRIESGNSMVLIGSLDTTENFQRMILQGQYIFGVRAGTNNLSIISVAKPNSPDEISSSPFNVGATTKGVHSQGRFVYVGCDGSIKIVDVSVPGSPSVVGTAT